MAIERWPEAERPRERLFWNGPEALADAELLAIQLGSGTRGRSAIDVAREMLAAYGSLAEVAARDVTELVRVAGVGPAKAARLAATFELTRRLRARTRPRAKRSLYDSGLRVPLMIRWPRSLTPPFASGTVSDQLVSFVDLAPTVLALAGVAIPTHLQGRVLVGPRFSVNSHFEKFSPRDPSNHLDGLWQYLYPARPTTT